MATISAALSGGIHKKKRKQWLLICGLPTTVKAMRRERVFRDCSNMLGICCSEAVSSFCLPEETAPTNGLTKVLRLSNQEATASKVCYRFALYQDFMQQEVRYAIYSTTDCSQFVSCNLFTMLFQRQTLISLKNFEILIMSWFFWVLQSYSVIYLVVEQLNVPSAH